MRPMYVTLRAADMNTALSPIYNAQVYTRSLHTWLDAIQVNCDARLFGKAFIRHEMAGKKQTINLSNKQATQN